MISPCLRFNVSSIIRSTDGLEQELKYLRELAELYKRSAISTQNFQNVLQASGLLNVCLVMLTPSSYNRPKNLRDGIMTEPQAKAQHQEVLREQVLQDLMEYSSSMMRRVLRIKVGLAERIHDWEVSRQHHDGERPLVEGLIYSFTASHVASLLSRITLHYQY
mgnify:CR=1 FL=1